MKKTPLLFLLFFILFGKLSAQEVNVQMGPEFKASRNATLSGILGFDNTGYYVLQNIPKGFRYQTMVSHFNKELTMTNQKLLAPKYEGKELESEGIFYMNNKIYLFTSFRNQKAGKKFLFYQTVDKTTLVPNNDLKKIDEIDFETKGNSGAYVFRTSEDTTKLLVVKQLPYEKGASERFELKVFDNNMNKIWERSITLPYEEVLFTIHRYRVGNEGNVYVLGRLYDEKLKEKRKGKVNYTYKILTYKGDKTDKEYHVTLGNKFITDLQLSISSKGEFLCAGFYSEMGTYSIAGTYFIKIDPASNRVISQNHKEFPKDFLTQYESEKETKRIEKKVDKGDDVELYEFDLDELIIREDGGAYLVGEQYYVRVVTYTTTDSQGRMSTRTVYYYNYHDMIVISFGIDGSIQWYEKVPKRQVSTNDGGFYSSYVRILNKDQLFFLFNDHVENLDTWSTGKLKNYTAGGKGVVTLVRLSKDGKQSREMLFKTKDNETITVPKVSEQISKGEVIMYGQKKKTHQFSKIVLK